MYELKVVVVVVVVVVVLHHPSSLSSQSLILSFLFSLVRDAHHPSPSLTIPQFSGFLD